jgi:hypothetical protein
MARGSNHDGEKLTTAWRRFWNNLEDPFDTHRDSRGRLGWVDIPHALMNLPVTLCREEPWLAGHLWLYSVPVIFLLGVLGGSLVTWLAL